jgi:hypothetical protein
VHDPTIDSGILKMQKPPFALRRIDKGALMRPVDRRGALVQNNSVLVRPENVSRPQNSLPACRNAAGRSQNIIPAVTLQKLGTLDCVVAMRFMENHPAFAKKMGAIW